MSTITTEQIKDLRDKTGVSVIQCKKALEEAGGDFDKAVIILSKKSSDMALKKADRTFAAGTITSYIHGSAKIGVLLELVSETDFVSGNKEFKDLAYNIAMQVAAANPQFLKREDVSEADIAKFKEVFVAEVADKPENMREKILENKLNSYLNERILLEQSYIKDGNMTIKALIDQAIQKFGEKIEVRRFVRFGVLE